jgi:hypothetical protein
MAGASDLKIFRPVICVHTKSEKTSILYVHFHRKVPLKALAHGYFQEKVFFRMYISRLQARKQSKCTDKFFKNADFVCMPVFACSGGQPYKANNPLRY